MKFFSLNWLILVVFLILGSFSNSIAQVDTEFWFAPPEVTSGHGDSPILLNISTLNEAAQVNVTQPARGNASLASFSLSANTTRTINLTSYISQLETDEGAVRNTGIKITSTNPITAYYEVDGTWNADIFTLKGKNALGNKFVIPAQNRYYNGSNYSPLPYSSFDIVATRNNTVVTIKPSNPVYGHESDSTITIKLNAGETYSLRNTTQNPNMNLGGSEVTSNKPIAITIKDDSVQNGSCYDLLGDQMVPVKVSGIEYIVLKGFLSTQENLFITATEDNTEIYINGSDSPSATLDKGEIFRYTITDKSTYILGSKSIYVFHTTGFGCELGMAILPSINCKGSQNVGFTRSTADFFGINILVRKEGINLFELNNNSNLVSGSSFTPVPGTNDEWYTAQLDFSTTEISVGQANQLENSQYSFQLGIVNGDENTTCRYGYFSAFSTLYLGDDIDMCVGDTQVLDAGPGKENYIWNTGDTTQSITADQAGTYWVRTEKELCVLYDTIKIETKVGSLNLGPDVSICPNDTTHIDGKKNFSWQWSNGSTDRYLETTEPGKYWLNVKDYTGCEASDTINVSLNDAPEVDLGPDILKCPNAEVELDASYPGATYQWNDGTNQPIQTVIDSGLYWVDVTYNGCTVRDSVLIENRPGPVQDTIYGSPSVCPFVENVAYETDHIVGSSYFWEIDGGIIDNQNGNTIEVDWKSKNNDAEVKLVVEDNNGCLSDTIGFPVRINVQLEVQKPAGPDTTCFNASDNQIYSVINTNGSTYNWNINGGMITSGQGTHEVIVDWQEEGQNQIEVIEESTTIDTVCVGTSEIKEVTVFKDSALVQLEYVSNDTIVDEQIHIQWDLQNEHRFKDDSIFLYRQLKGRNWELSNTFPVSITSYTDVVNINSTPVSYQLSSYNKCEEELNTAIHQNILLTGESDTVEDKINLEWTPYKGWADGVEKYEIWRKLDNDSSFRFFKEFQSSQLSFEGQIGADGFEHTYVIRAIEENGNFKSWSNNVGFKFKHPVVIPNVITPNGDGKNDYFEIKKIELYNKSELTISNRNGKVIYSKVGYKNDWNGSGLSSGVYYYHLNLNRNGMAFRGIINILK